MIRSKLDGLQPKLTVSSLPPYMDVDRLIAIKAVEEKPERSRDVLDSGHSLTMTFPPKLPRNLLSLFQPPTTFKSPKSKPTSPSELGVWKKSQV
jgi:hypothetical protein